MTDVIKIDIEYIKIPKSFKRTRPREEKLDKVRNYFDEWGKLDKPITIDDDYMLVDGYSRYVVAKEKGMKLVPVIQDFGVKDMADIETAFNDNDTDSFLPDPAYFKQKYKEHLDKGESEYIKGVFISNDSPFAKEYTWINRKGLFIDVGDIVKVKVVIGNQHRTGIVRVTEKFWSSNEPEHRSVTSIVSKVGADNG